MNILVIMCDQLRYDALSCQGGFGIETPNLNRLAQRSVRFHNAYCQAPLCGPTRHSLATGLYPYEHGVINNQLLPVDGMRTVAHMVREGGHRAHCFGHMHWQRLPGTEGHVFPDHGFEHYGAISLGDYPMDPDIEEHSMWEHMGWTQRRTAGLSALSKDEFLGAHVVRESMAQLRDCRERGESYLNWASFNEPHPPFFAPAEFYSDIDHGALPLPIKRPPDASPDHQAVERRRRTQWSLFNDWDHRRMRAGYFGLVRLADAYVGEILDELDRLDAWKDTAVIFTVDHGEMLGDHDLYFKFVFNEAAVHIPMMICHPDFEPGDRHALVEHTDIAPTICDIAGVCCPESVRGKSLVPLLSKDLSPDAWRPYAFSQQGNAAMLRTHRYKLNIYDGEPGELYDLEADPNEFYNRVDDPAMKPVVEDLCQRMKQDHPNFEAANAALLKANRRRRKKRKPALVMQEIE